ncbi:hypothetical protein SERLA73DRAFT_83492 [Serpula lacrymans var. lacrymans S7.3]|uniref:Protein HIR n=2 Tax=Serpula lacrymans var. lacrymans TaxID=341189 RepID=F8PJS0_SERL3|nr:histone transcription regulator 1 [Serpula lacrymans var. lacrymans S7.9]EGO03480.1 hypothetical protein SERLA73DRAFT_83492 [Serpula lacrymans var. lacrymans S7.3]EGO29237.1 histone transcription regulator 1 [Serpula lacrymans var. lacrymans S7.9]
MKFTKPAWVMHKDSAAKNDQNPKRLSIFSVHVHPDGSRIATGGLDAKIRIWSTKPILNPASEMSNRPPKSLCTLSMHTGPVLTVRWAHSGRWLASGSDDEIVMVWDLDPTARGKVWGSDEVNVEGWKPLKRLPGHESDVTDVAWSPGDRYLASVGLDSQVLVWCGYTLERLRKLDQHQGFVKGVCWDPVGEFLATQSDDRTVKIWRTTDWQLEAEIRKPFEDSPGSTFFRRLSWSPDGAHITASNATNNKGFVFIAAVITRGTWTSEISLVGHENTVEVASYNPHIFLRNPSSPIATSNICSVVALGADDRSVSVWQTKSARPLIVAREVFERQIMDLSWSWDGLTLYAASSDGTLAVFHFDPEELEGIAPHSAQEQYLQKFGFTPPPIPEGFSHGAPARIQDQDRPSSHITPPPSPTRSNAPSSNVQSQTGFGMTNGANGGEQINQLVAKRGKKKRIQPVFMGGLAASIPSASVIPMATSLGNSVSRLGDGPQLPKSSRHPSHSVSPMMHTSNDDFGFTSRSHSHGGHEDVTMDSITDMDVPIDSLDNNGSLSVNKGKRKASALDLPDERPSKPRTLGGDRPRDTIAVREIGNGNVHISHTRSFLGGSIGLEGEELLPVPPLLTFLSAKVEGTEDVFEGRNSEGDGPTEIIYVNGKQTQWLDYLPSPILALTATTSFCAVAMRDGSVNVYSHTGRRFMPTLSLGSPCSMIHGCKGSLMTLTASGQLSSWNVKKQRSYFTPVSVAQLLSSSPNCTILSATVRHNGAPIIQCSTGVAFSYDPALTSWTKLSERWWSEGSDVWQGRQRPTKDVVASIEAAISASGDDTVANKQRPSWWTTALTLGHLETKMYSAKVLDSPQEYKQTLLVYAKNIADEGFRAKAEELIKEFFGPIFWRPGLEDVWSPSVLGMSKRDLLREVLVVFARSKTLTKLAMDWQDTLKKASNEEH